MYKSNLYFTVAIEIFKEKKFLIGQIPDLPTRDLEFHEGGLLFTQEINNDLHYLHCLYLSVFQQKYLEIIRFIELLSLIALET